MIANTIHIENIGPIRRLDIPLPPRGGVVVLRGRNGSGKSAAIAATQTVLSGEGKLRVRDGAHAGRVDGCGVTIAVGRSTQRLGELEVESIAGKLSIDKLVDPAIQSPGAADEARIKALVSLTNARPDVSLFHELLGGSEEFERIVGTLANDAGDLVTMSGIIKRAIEQAARKAETDMATAAGKAQAAEAAAKGPDIGQESREEVLQAELEAAIAVKANLESQARAAKEGQAKVDESLERMRLAEAEYTGLAVPAAKAEESQAKDRLDVSMAKVREAEESLARAKAEADAARTALATAISHRKHAEQHERTIAEAKAELAKAVPDAPSDAALSAARDRVEEARRAAETGVLIRRALIQLAIAEKHREDYSRLASQAAQLRAAAGGVYGVLSAVVGQANSVLRVEAGRLVLDTPRGVTFFAELSAGERWKIAIDIAVKIVGERGLLACSQEAWEGLDPQSRNAIAEHCESRGVTIVTGEATADEGIVVEQYQRSDAAAV